MNEVRKMTFSLRKKTAVMVMGIALLLSTILIALSYYHYRSEMYEHYEEFAMNIAAVAASQLDPDRIDGWLETGEKDEAYEKSFETLCKIREHGGVEYLYVVKPEVDEVWYVMDTDPSEGAIPLGFHEPYYQGAFAQNAQKMANGENVGPLVSNEEFGWLMSVYYPMKTSAGKPAGYVGVDIQMTDVMTDLHRFVRQMIILVALLAAGCSAVLIAVTTKSLVEPIRQITDSAAQLVAEERSREGTETSIFSKLTIDSNDEVGLLYDSLSRMEQDMNAYVRDLVEVTSEKERIGAELNVATKIQADMLPNIFPPFPDRHEFRIFASMNPAKEVGGDFYDFFLIDENRLALVMADVSGKGVPAALFMVVAKTLLKNRALMGDSPSEILFNVNNQLCDGNEAELFVTVWLAILDLTTGKGLAANAGHEHPVLCRKDGTYELVQYRHSPAVAAVEGIRFREHEFELHPGDRLFVYTDGVPEATDAENRMFGTDRMLEALNRDPESPPEVLLPRVKAAIDNFVGDAPQFDDITMMGLWYEGPDTLRKTAGQAGDTEERVPVFEHACDITVEARKENLGRVLGFAEEHLVRIGCPRNFRIQMGIAVEELFMNIAKYAYTPGTGNVTIRVAASRTPMEVSITFSDKGAAYNPLDYPAPDITLSAEERSEGGLGIHMVRNSMDSMEYERKSGYNVLTIRRKLENA